MRKDLPRLYKFSLSLADGLRRYRKVCRLQPGLLAVWLIMLVPFPWKSTRSNERLTYRFNGRDFRLTDVSGNVIRDIIA